MRAVTVIQTRDGKHHASERDARRHAEKVYGEALSKAVINILQYPKYVDLHAALEAMLEGGTFAELQVLRADLALKPEEGE